MTISYELKDDNQTAFDKFLQRLNETQLQISTILQDIRSNLYDFLTSQTQEDLQKMIETSQRAEKIIQEGLDLELIGDNNETLWKQIRHDLRATVGSISGYSELILEEFEELGHGDHSVILKFKQLREFSQEQLPFIDKLRSEESAGYITPYGGLYEEAAAEGNKKEITIGKVMVVDDDEHKRNILFRRLKKNGHKVVLAENGHRALEILQKEPVDLILLDILMPGMNGTEVLMKLKSNDTYKNIPVLVISSLNDVESVVECIKIGAEDYLPMPFNPILLMARVHTCLDKKKLRDREIENLSELDRMRQQLEAALESIEDGFAVFNLFDEMTMCNKKFQEIYPATKTIVQPDYSYREFLETNYKANRYQIERRRKQDKPESFEDWIELRMSRHQFAKEPYMEQLDDGRWIEISENRTPDGGTVSIHKDVTHSKEGEDQLKFLAHHDPLTGLANRSLFEESLQAAFEEALTTQLSFGVMYLDLDGFKKVNDLLGHEFGDYLLTQVAEKLLACVREEDIVARLGGDEFAILIHNIDGIDSIKKLADRILKAIGNSVVRDNKSTEFGVSVGVSIFPVDGKSIEEVLLKADQAMYAAKRAGKGAFRLAEEL